MKLDSAPRALTLPATREQRLDAGGAVQLLGFISRQLFLFFRLVDSGWLIYDRGLRAS